MGGFGQVGAVAYFHVFKRKYSKINYDESRPPLAFADFLPLSAVYLFPLRSQKNQGFPHSTPSLQVSLKLTELMGKGSASSPLLGGSIPSESSKRIYPNYPPALWEGELSLSGSAYY